MFIEHFPDLLEYANTLKGKLLVVGDFNFHFDSLLNVHTSKLQDIISIFHLSQTVISSTHIHGHTIDWVLHGEEECILKSLSADSILLSDHSSNLKPPTSRVYREVRKVASIAIDSFKADLLADPALSSRPSADQLFRSFRTAFGQTRPCDTSPDPQPRRRTGRLQNRKEYHRADLQPMHSL